MNQSELSHIQSLTNELAELLEKISDCQDSTLYEKCLQKAENIKLALINAETDTDVCRNAPKEVIDIESCLYNLEEAQELSQTEISDTHKQSSKTSKPVFSINDRFRFIRTLFNSNAAVFDAALTDIITLDSYEEAEEYFLEQYQWLPEDDETQAFLQIIKNYFK